LLSSVANIKRAVEAMHALVRAAGDDERAEAFNAEWDVALDHSDIVASAGKIQLLQLGYYEPGKKPYGLLLRARGKALTRALNYFAALTTTFIGRGAGVELGEA
jgi:hypothetical protein